MIAPTRAGSGEPPHCQLQAHVSMVFLLKRKRNGKKVEWGDERAASAEMEAVVVVEQCSGSAFVLKQAHGTARVSLLLGTNECQV